MLSDQVGMSVTEGMLIEDPVEPARPAQPDKKQPVRRSRIRNNPEGFAEPRRSRGLVEPDGVEPTTSCLQSRRSTN